MKKVKFQEPEKVRLSKFIETSLEIYAHAQSSVLY